MKPRRPELMLSFCALLLAAAALVVAIQSGALAANDSAAKTNAVIPSTFNYQGIMRNAGGVLINGVFKITARIYALPSGGTALYQETFDNVTVRDGLFNIVLGDNPTTPLEDALNDSPRYIGIAVDNDPEQSPRQRIHAVPWALLANNAISATTALSATTAIDAQNAVNAQNATNAQNAINAQNATNAQNAVNAQNAATATTLVANANVASMNITGNLSVKGNSPVRIIRYVNLQLTDNTTTVVNTGVSYPDYYCTFAGWAASYDVNEVGTGPWSRWLNVSANNTWEMQFFNHVQNNPLVVSAEIVCYRQGLYQWEVGSTQGAAADNIMPEGTLPSLGGN